jgi:Zn-dependent peptidase ImmA (M78 family)/transcriptional regulator with XRE-family HTH domain
MFGDRLRLARKRAGLSLRDLSDRLDNKVSAQAISKYEANSIAPSSSVLVALAKALDVSLDFLMSEEEITLSGLSFRRAAGTSAQDRNRVEAEVLSHVERYLAIEEVLGLDSAAHALSARPRDKIERLDESEQLASKLRKEWNLGIDPIPSMTHLLEDKGFKVLRVALPAKVSGLTCDVERPDKPKITVIVVNSSLNVERWRFTLAHELAHHVIGEAGDGIKIEKAVDRFAGAFLMPKEHVLAEIGKRRTALAYEELMRLKHFYGVSAASFIYRLGTIGVIDDSMVAYAFQTYARAWRTGEPNPIDPRGDLAVQERPERFERLVYRAVSEHLISTSKAALLLSRPVPEIEYAVKGPALAHADHRK